MTLVSVVMPSFQQVEFVERAVESVLSQRGVDVELLVFDPGSTDGSRELLSELCRRNGDRLALVFAPDRGQSQAVNRGMALARGQMLGWLNSDDYLLPGALQRVAESIAGRQGPAWLYGRAAIVDARDRRTAGSIARYKSLRGRRFSFFKLLTENFIPQMAVFWNRRMWDCAGGLDESRALDMDYDLWLRFAAVACPVVLPVELAAFRVHPCAVSCRRSADQLRAAEETAGRYAKGWSGALALAVHRVFQARTRLVYSWTKP